MAAVDRASVALAAGIVLAEDNMAVVRRMENAVVALAVHMLVVRSLGGSLAVAAGREVVDGPAAGAGHCTAMVQDNRWVEAAVVRCKSRLADLVEGTRSSQRCNRLDEDVVVLE